MGIKVKTIEQISRRYLLLYLNNNAVMRMWGDPYEGVFYTGCFDMGIPVDEKSIDPKKQRKIFKKSGIDLEKDGVYEELCMQIVKSIQTQHNSRFTSRNGKNYIIQFDDLEPAKGGNKIDCNSTNSEKIDSNILKEQEQRSSSQRKGIFGKCKQQENDKPKDNVSKKRMG